MALGTSEKCRKRTRMIKESGKKERKKKSKRKWEKYNRMKMIWFKNVTSLDLFPLNRPKSGGRKRKRYLSARLPS